VPGTPWGPSHIEFDLIAFVQRPETDSLKGGMMHENIVPRSAADKSVAFFIVELLYCSLFFHFFLFLLLPRSLGRTNRNFLWGKCEDGR
jgi:hypothetical protein